MKALSFLLPPFTGTAQQRIHLNGGLSLNARNHMKRQNIVTATVSWFSYQVQGIPREPAIAYNADG